uniref:Methyl-accepting transducer domain-containing protein n=1 Tax=Caldimicrobium thiodismutans TaxID=1653476 RepID=A0A832LXF4_9BACT
MRKSIIARLFLTFIPIFIALLVIFFYFLYEVNQLRSFGVLINQAGILSLSTQAYLKDAHFFCEIKQKSSLYAEKIKKSKNNVKEAFSYLKEGKGNSKNVKSLADEKALDLLKEVDKGYEEFLDKMDRYISTCEEELVLKIDEEVERLLTKSMELTNYLASISQSEMNKMLLSLIILFLLISTLLVLALIFTYKSVRNSLKEINKVIKNLEKGNFKEVNVSSVFDDFKPIVLSLNNLSMTFEKTLAGMNTANKVIVDTIKNQKESINEISPLALQIDSLVDKVDESGKELTEAIALIEQSTEEMKSAISEISQNTLATAERSKLVRASAEETQETVLSLEKAMHQIRDITEIIRGIAEQTNLLALNASIEAARAGEAGKGFAVVANEVKELAKKVSDFTGDIERIMEELSQQVKNAVEKVEITKEMVDEVEKASTTIAGAVEEQTAVTNSIVESALQTKERSFSLISEIEDLRKVSEKLKRVLAEFQAECRVLEEITLTYQIIGELYVFEERAITDETLKNLDLNSLINLAILGHVNWKMQFLSSAIRGRVPQVERDHRKCLLGRSMEYLRMKLAHTSLAGLLDKLEEPHAKMHQLVERFEREVNLKDIEDILKFIDKEVLPTFAEVMGYFKELKKG